MAELMLASAADDIKFWDVQGFDIVKQYNPHGGNVTSLSWSHDNSCIASASGIGDKLALSYINAGFYTKDIAVDDKITCTAFNSNSRYVMGGGLNGHIHVWDLKTHKLKKSYRDHKDAVTALQFNWNDTVIASASQSGEIILYNVVTGLGYSPLKAPKVQAIRQVQYSHFKKSLIGSVSDDGAVNMWDTNTKRLLQSYSDTHKAPATGLAFSPLNEMLMMSVGLDKHIVCYDVQGKTAVKTMTAESPLTSIDLMSDGTTLAVGSTRGKIYLYDLRSGDEPFKKLTAHKSSVQNLKFQSNLNQNKSGIGGAKPARRAMSNPAIQAKRAQFESGSNNNKPSQRSSHLTKKDTNGMTAAKSVPDMDGVGKSLTDRTNKVNFADQQRDRGSSLGETLPVRGRDSDLSSGIVSPLRDTTQSQRRDGTPQSDRGSFENHSDRLCGIENATGRISSEIFSPLGNNHLSNRTNNNPVPSLPERNTESPPHTQKGGLSSISLSPDRQEDIFSTRPQSITRNSSGLMHTLSPPSSQSASHSSREDARADNAPSSRTSRDHPPRLLSDYPDSSESTRAKSSSRSLSPPSDLAPSFSNQVRHELARVDATSGASGMSAEYVPATAECAPDSNFSPFHVKFIRNMIEDAMEEFRDQMRRDVLNLHMEMLKQFQIQQTEMKTMLQHYSVNEQLIAEIEHLKEENRRLKKKF